MSELLPVELVFQGEPFDEGAVRHTLRHLAMRVGWRFVRCSPHRLVYLTADGSNRLQAGTNAVSPVVVASTSATGEHLRKNDAPIPMARQADGRLLPFPCPGPVPRRGWVSGDVVAGAHACLNLWYEQRTGPAPEDGWIRCEQDWMFQAGLPDPLPLADQWLDMIYEAALQAGWPPTKREGRATIVLTHDVDYLPGRWDFGLPRFARALYRQVMLRKRPEEAFDLVRRYAAVIGRGEPYAEMSRIVAAEAERGARSSFQFVVARRHRLDPRYAGEDIDPALPAEWEVCLHGSYLAARTPGALAAERTRLEALAGRPVRGYRQHYLNFEPSALFRELAAAGLRYDLSVGYNDRSGPRAGTYFPYRPYDLGVERPYSFWEIPFVLMDTTLATTYRLGRSEALAHAERALEPVITAAGSVAIIWHQEQCGGLLDPGYERVYVDLLDWLAARGARLTTGASLLPELDEAWEATVDRSPEWA